jgi:hydroxyacylglutathione hydrolase
VFFATIWSMYEFQIVPIPAFQDNYIWTIVHQRLGLAIIIDPGDPKPIRAYLEKHKLSLSAILITHHHPDHTGGIRSLANTKIPVYGPTYENIPCITHELADEQNILIEDYNLNFKIIHIPGHTLGHIAYLYKDLLFCGDTLFSAGCGRLFEGTPEQMFTSLSKLKSLPKDTVIYPTHEYTLKNLEFALAMEPDNNHINNRLTQCEELRRKGLPTLPSTIEIELRTNPFLRYSKTLIATAQEHLDTEIRSELELFTALRKLKDSWAT